MRLKNCPSPYVNYRGENADFTKKNFDILKLNQRKLKQLKYLLLGEKSPQKIDKLLPTP